MPSGITHVLLTRSLQRKIENEALKDILAAGRDYFQIGAVGPDLPYASIVDDYFFSNESELADNFHYNTTNQLPLKAMKRLRNFRIKTRGNDLEILDAMFSFFLGFISHIIADGVIHPFVRDKVGDYKDNKAEHRKLEMCLDVLLFELLYKDEFNYSNIHDELINLNKDTKIQKIVDKVISEFSLLIDEVYNQKYEVEKIKGWVTGLHRLFSVAEGDHPQIYRDISLFDGVLYKNKNDLIAKKDELLNLTATKEGNKNFLAKEKINFFDDCIPRYYKIFMPRAIKAYEYVYNDGVELTDSDIPAIDLDTGRPENDRNNLKLTPVFWR